MSERDESATTAGDAVTLDVLLCRACDRPVFLAELPGGLTYKLLDIEPSATGSGFVPVPSGRVTTPRFTPATSATSGALLWRVHWDTCPRLTSHEREFVTRYDPAADVRPRSDRSVA